AVMLDFCQQDTVGHQLDQRAGNGVVAEAYLVTHLGAQRHLQFLGNAGGDRPRCQPARLGVANQALDAVAELKTYLGYLGSLAGAGLTGNDDDLMLLQGSRDVAATLGNGKLLGIADSRHTGAPQLLTFIQWGHAALYVFSFFISASRS